MSEISKQTDLLSDGLEAVTHFDEFVSWLQLVPQSDYLTILYVWKSDWNAYSCELLIFLMERRIFEQSEGILWKL